MLVLCRSLGGNLSSDKHRMVPPFIVTIINYNCEKAVLIHFITYDTFLNEFICQRREKCQILDACQIISEE
jgi:hypothetical protein